MDSQTDTKEVKRIKLAIALDEMYTIPGEDVSPYNILPCDSNDIAQMKTLLKDKIYTVVILGDDDIWKTKIGWVKDQFAQIVDSDDPELDAKVNWKLTKDDPYPRPHLEEGKRIVLEPGYDEVCIGVQNMWGDANVELFENTFWIWMRYHLNGLPLLEIIH